MRYMRVCKRCNNIFNAPSKHTKICPKCVIVKRYKTRYTHEKVRKDTGYYYLVPSATYQRMVREIEDYRLSQYKKEDRE